MSASRCGGRFLRLTQQLANQKDAFNSNSVFSHGIDGFVDRLSGLSCSGNFEQPRRLSSSQAETAAPSNGLESPLRDTESIETIRSRIFGTHIGNGLRSGRKVLSKKLLGPVVEAYYPKDIFAGDPLLVDLDAERAKHKLDRLKRRGKAPPKKGAGKRAQGKKK